MEVAGRTGEHVREALGGRFTEVDADEAAGSGTSSDRPFVAIRSFSSGAPTTVRAHPAADLVVIAPHGNAPP